MCKIEVQVDALIDSNLLKCGDKFVHPYDVLIMIANPS